MSVNPPTEQLVEDVAAVYFGAIGASTKHEVEIDDAGERSDAAQCLLNGSVRVGAAVEKMATLQEGVSL